MDSATVIKAYIEVDNGVCHMIDSVILTKLGGKIRRQISEVIKRDEALSRFIYVPLLNHRVESVDLSLD